MDTLINANYDTQNPKELGSEMLEDIFEVVVSK